MFYNKMLGKPKFFLTQVIISQIISSSQPVTHSPARIRILAQAEKLNDAIVNLFRECLNTFVSGKFGTMKEGEKYDWVTVEKTDVENAASAIFNECVKTTIGSGED